MIRSVLIFLLFILSGTGGEIAIAYGIKATGEPERLRPKQLLIFLGRALRNVSFWVGIPQLALSFYLLLLLLSWKPLSIVIPASALTYVFGTLAAKYILGEQISPQRWAGVALVCAGVALIAVS